MTAPDRIWADYQETFGAIETGTWADCIRFSKQQIEYTRTDLIQPQIEAAVKAAMEAAAKRIEEMGAREQADFGLCRSAQNYYRARDEIRALADDPAFMARMAGKGE